MPRKRTFAVFKLLLVAICMTIAFQLNEALGENGFSVKKIGHMVSHSTNLLSVNAPEKGILTVTIRDDYHVYRVFSEYVAEGESQISWDGCSYNLEKLNTKTYRFECMLAGESGRNYSCAFQSPVVNNAQFLQFALPSSETVFLLSADEWFLEAKTILDGKIRIEFYSKASDEPVLSIQKTTHKGRVEHFTFDQITGKKTLIPGSYTVCVYESANPENKYSFQLDLLDESVHRTEIPITGNIMPPDDADDAMLWKAMMEPAVVVDIDYLKHQNVYQEMNLKSTVLGTLHGQTQCLSVLEKNGEWAKVGAWNHEDASYIEGWVPLNVLKVAYPAEEYGLLLNKKEQTLTVFRRGERIETLLVSTGRMAADKYFRETSAGCFITGLHRVDFSMEGSRYDFVIQYDGGNLLHQIPYSSAGIKDFSRGKPYLGAKASHACIRIQDEPGEVSGINAYWIWTHIPYHTKLIIFDDREEREKEMAVLSGNTPYFHHSGTITDSNLKDSASNEKYAVFTFGGDVISGDKEGTQNTRNSFKMTIDKYGTQYPFSELLELFTEDDLTCVDFACVLKENSRNADQRKKTTFRGLPEYASILSKGSVELVNLINDHTDDYKDDGFASTAAALEDVVCYIGKDHIRTIEIKNCLFGFGACTEKEYIADYHIIEKDIQKLKDAGCRYIIYQCHWGEEKGTHHTNLQNAMARACRRAGADLVIGHHPNAPQGIDYIGGMPVVYSLGKLLTAGSNTYDALIVRAVFTVSGEKETPMIQFIPVLRSSSYASKTNDFKPVIAAGEERKRILNAIQADSPYLISISGDQ